MCLVHYFMAAHIFSVARGQATIDGLAIHLGQQDVGNSAHYRVRRTLQQIGQAYQKPALSQSNGVVYVRKGKKFDLQFRQRRARTQLPVFLMEDFEQSLTHSEPRLARAELIRSRAKSRRSLRPAASLPRVRFLAMLGSLFLVSQSFAVVLGCAVQRIERVAQNKFVLLGFLWRSVRCIP